MDRMEALLERLLIFSSEQALQSQPRAVDCDEVALLRQEISELRAAIQQADVTGASSQDVAALREDVASLRTRLGLPPTSAGNQVTRTG